MGGWTGGWIKDGKGANGWEAGRLEGWVSSWIGG